MLGDMIQGEQIGHKVDLAELERDAYGQKYEIIIPGLSNFLVNLLQVYPEIHVYGIRGNHGRPGKYASLRTNWDTDVYMALKMTLSQYERIKFYIEADEFYQIVELDGWKFFLVHGDQVPVTRNLPLYGFRTRVMNWYTSIGGVEKVPFHFLCSGHFHTRWDFYANTIRCIGNGSFVTDDQWVLNVLGLVGQCCQETFGIHKRRGISWTYPLSLDKE